MIKEENKPIYKEFKMPFYRVDRQRVNGVYALVAKEIGKKGHSIEGYKGNYSIKSITEVGVRLFWAKSTLIPVLDYNVEDLDDIIVEVEKENQMRKPNQDFYLNAYKLGMWNRRRTSDRGYDYFEHPAEFYHIDIGSRICFLTLKKKIQSVQQKFNKIKKKREMRKRFWKEVNKKW